MKRRDEDQVGIWAAADESVFAAEPLAVRLKFQEAVDEERARLAAARTSYEYDETVPTEEEDINGS